MNSSTISRLAGLAGVILSCAACHKPAESARTAEAPLPEPAAQAQVAPGANAALGATVAADWAVDAVWYQIFPERFRNGDPANDPTRDSLERPLEPSAKWRLSSWTADWYARAPWEQELGPNFYADGVLDRRYGGDLQGVLDKLDYLAGLGVNALYFNPLFFARSLHKYDGNSFHHINPFFGPDPQGDLALIAKEDGPDPKTWTWTAADKLFLKVLAEAHRRGMHVILDGVFNHTGRDSFAFLDLRKNQAHSRFRNWYVVESFDDPRTRRDEFDYRGWWGYKSLPVFAATADGKDMAAEPKAYIFAATKRWMAPEIDGQPGEGIDGWRLDAAPERPNKFWADWNTYVRTLNPKAYTSCEIWDDASSLIAAGKFSASMNYHAFAIPVKGFLVDGRISAKQFVTLLNTRRRALPPASVNVMQNLMDSHDTDRLASMIVNAGLANYSDPEKIEYNANSNAHLSAKYQIRRPNERERAIQRLVVLFQMTYAGAPMIYYGDEAGMWGGTDPDDRMPMTWEDLKFAPQAIDQRGIPRSPDAVGFEAQVFDFYQAAIALRKAHPALRRGEFQMIGTFDDAQTLAFERRGAGEALLIVLNRSDRAQTVRLTFPGENAASLAAVKTILATGGKAPGTDIGLEPGAGVLEVEMPALTGAVLAR